MESKKALRRWHSRDLKVEVLAACDEPGASVAAVAMAHGLNTNLVHKWRRNAAGRSTLPASESVANSFVALTLPPSAVAAKLPDIRIELRRGATTVMVNWPMAGAGECAAWLRDWLR
jgi:transposase